MGQLSKKMILQREYLHIMREMADLTHAELDEAYAAFVEIGVTIKGFGKMNLAQKRDAIAAAIPKPPEPTPGTATMPRDPKWKRRERFETADLIQRRAGSVLPGLPEKSTRQMNRQFQRRFGKATFNGAH